jgi:hypothetical protein
MAIACAAGAYDAGVSADLNGPMLSIVDAGVSAKPLDPIFLAYACLSERMNAPETGSGPAIPI